MEFLWADREHNSYGWEVEWAWDGREALDNNSRFKIGEKIEGKRVIVGEGGGKRSFVEHKLSRR